MSGWLCPDAGVFDGKRLLDGHAVRPFGAGIQVAPSGEVSARAIRGVVTPGFIDIQVNGGGGVLLNADPAPGGIARIAVAHRPFGTGALLPTLITDTSETTEAAADAALATFGRNGVLGLHLEGPHIAPSRRGTHRADLVRPFDARTLALVTRLRAHGCPVLVTLAPEAVSRGDIAALVATGARVSLGHSDAKAPEIARALTEGASGFTHLFNAMSPLEGRAPGMVGTAIASDAYVSMILDGIHVAPEMLALAMRARPRGDRSILISDAMPTVGGPPRFDLQGQTIALAEGRLVNAEGNLAGAHTTMAEGVLRATRDLRLPLETALRMAITHPAAFLGIDIGLARSPSGFMRFDPATGDVGWLAPPPG